MQHPVPASRPAIDSATLEAVVIDGDLAKLSPEQRLAYYRMRCEAAGVDPRAQPFLYIVLNTKLRLYATKACTDQLIATRKLTVEEVDEHFDQALGVYKVRTRVTFPNGQKVENRAAVAVAGLKGDALCNAMMKCTTKSQRRTVLTACGLGELDETEVETIPGARTMIPAEVEPIPAPSPRGEFAIYLQTELDGINNEWKLVSGRDEKLVANVWQVLNGVVTDWIEHKVIPADEVITGTTRDKLKVKDLFRRRWQENPGEVRASIGMYLQGKLERSANEAGINLDAEPEEETADDS